MSEEHDVTIQDAIGYSFKGLSDVRIIEDIINELHIESDKYWMRPATDEDWFPEGDWIISRDTPNPELIDEYELQYNTPYDETNESIVKFAEYLIDSYLEYIGYLEACLEKEMEESNGTSNTSK